MTVIDTKRNFAWECVSKVKAANIIGVHRHTITRWEEARKEDGTFKEVYNHFEIYFNTTTHRQKKGINLSK